MADETTAPATDQPVSSATVEPSQETGAFAGDGFEEFSAAMNSEPTAKETTTEEPAAVSEDAQTTEEQKTEPAAEEKTSEEDDPNWLPDEQEKEFPLDTLAKYAKRYGFTPEEAKSDPRIQRIIKDKINSDILIRDQQNGEEEEPTQELTEETDPATEAATPEAQAKQAQEVYQKRIENLVTTNFSPELVDQIGNTIVNSVVEGVFGISAKSLENPNLDPEAKEELQRIVANSQTVAKTLGPQLARGMADAVITILPHVLTDAIEQIYPGTQRRHQVDVVTTAWDSIRNQKDDSGQPLYKDLPAFGPASGPFGDLIRKTEKEMGLKEGGLARMELRGNDGKPLSQEEQLAQKYLMVAKTASGQRVSPADAAKLIDKGKQQQQDANRRRQQGKVLGAGKPAPQFENGKEDPLLNGLEDFAKEYEASSKPFGE